MSNLKKILLEKKTCKSVWFMRQAGRYLPEFRKIRSENSDFIRLCLNSELSSKISLQPIKRFNLDSVIIFSDILMTPYALGQDVNFKKKMGPKLSKFNIELFLDNNKRNFSDKLEPIYKAISLTKRKIGKKKTLIGFVGAPWTLLVYILNLKTTKTNLNLSELNKNTKLKIIFNKLINFICLHIKNQINAGADVIQIFDSWAGLIPETKQKDYCFLPNARIVEYCKKNKIPNICFPKGIKNKYKNFTDFVKPDGINIDYDIDPNWAKKKLINVVIQGGLDPKLLLGSETKMLEGATKYIKAFKGIPYVFNLGHGLLPETDPDKVKTLVEFYRNFNE